MADELLELSRRRLGLARAPRLLDLLRRPGGGETGVPEVWNEGVRSFYELLGAAGGPRRCVGTACRLARGELGGQVTAGAVGPALRCLGRCFEAPAETGSTGAAIPAMALTRDPLVLRHVLAPGREAMLADYDLPDGEAILAAVESCGLRGRGGAAYPTAAKWRAARVTSAPDRVVVANGDEGDPGAYVDRLLLEEAPHSVLAGMLACARAIGAGRGILYVRAEYPAAFESARRAVAEAEAMGLLDGVRVEVLLGAGSYVAGEETALLRSIEGRRAEPSPKPPYPAERGLWGLPTVVQNVETLSIVPALVLAAGARRADTKAVCLSGDLARTGVVEIDFGTPLRTVLEEGGGGPLPGHRWKMALVGGPLGRVVAARDFDVPLSFEALPGMGHAGVVVFDEGVSVRALAEHLFEFARGESCGACTPCRVGTSRLAACRSAGELDRLMATLEEGSLCGFGQGVPRPLRDLLADFGDEVFA